MIEKIKDDLKRKIGNSVVIKVDIGRNKYEVYEGFLEKLYDNVFIINIKGIKKSFSYSDILINSIILKFV